MNSFPENIANAQVLEEVLSTPSLRLIEDLNCLNGDLTILGVGGKMGPSLAKLAKKALDKGNNSAKIYAVARFSKSHLQKELESLGIICIKADLLKEEDYHLLPKTENVIFMAGMKFGSSDQEAHTWAMNTYMPGRVAEHYKGSKIVVFSTGNVYPLTSISTGGPDENVPTGPIGEYAQSCLGRERVFQYFSQKHQSPILLFRLNYAIDLRYGVLMDIAKCVWDEKEIDLSMGHVNVIWQGDANEYALRSLLHANVSGKVLNITGPELISIEWLANTFGKCMQKIPRFIGEVSQTALLSNAAESFHLFGYPSVSLQQMILWTADWIMRGGEELGKPTHFQERKGNF